MRRKEDGTMFAINQIVRGKVAGVFVVVGKGFVMGALHYSVKAVNPDNLAETAPGEMLFSEDMLKPYH
jgi:hypothetical protein